VSLHFELVMIGWQMLNLSTTKSEVYGRQGVMILVN